MCDQTDNLQLFGVTPHYLTALVIAGRKTVTSSGKAFYALENEPLPQAGELQIFTDRQRQPLVKVRLVEVATFSWGAMPERWALAEGEGDYAYWQTSHRDFFQQEIGRLPPNQTLAGVENGQICDQFEVLCERFEVVEIFPLSYAQWLNFATLALQEASTDPYLNAKLDANLLLQAVVKRTKSAIFAFSETPLSTDELQQLASLLVRRIQGEPMAYILGEKEFWTLNLEVSEETLIPRPDTEILVEQAVEKAKAFANKKGEVSVLDLGTGTGAIALAIASELKKNRINTQVIGVDLFDNVVALAQRNAVRNGLPEVQFLQSSWFENLAEQQFDLIVSNPPYIDEDDENLSRGDVRFEPLSALVADNHGLADLQNIIEQAPLYLSPNGLLLLEHGWQQAAAVQGIFQQHQWQNIRTVQDYGGNDRITMAQRK